MRLTHYIREDLVVTDLAGDDTRETLRRVAQILRDRGAVDSVDDVEQALVAREEMHTTAMGGGVALPHATLEGLTEPVLMVAVAPEPVPFGPDDTDPVRVFFVLLSPPGHESEHIKILARICRLVRDPTFVDRLVESGSGQEGLRVIEDVDGQHV